MTTQILTEANALSLILNHARSVGLPLPRTFRYDEGCERLVLCLHTPQDVREWSRWMEAELEEFPSGRETYFVAEGTALDARIRVTAFRLDDTREPEVDAVGLDVPSEAVSDGEHMIGGAA